MVGSYSSPEPLTNVTTWMYDGQSHTPVAKFTEKDCYSIVQDHLGTPTQVFVIAEGTRCGTVC